MTALEMIERLEKLAKEATPGPWVQAPDIRRCDEQVLVKAKKGNFIVAQAFAPRLVDAETNAEFIAESRNAIDTLCAMFREAVEVATWAQCVLTALNVGDVAKDSALHLKLREVMINYRDRLDQLASGEREGG